jgi:ribosomal protein S8
LPVSSIFTPTKLTKKKGRYKGSIIVIYLYKKVAEKANYDILTMYSTPRRELYLNVSQLRYLSNKTQVSLIYVISTSQGLLTLPEALKKNVGGVLIFSFLS